MSGKTTAIQLEEKTIHAKYNTLGLLLRAGMLIGTLVIPLMNPCIGPKFDTLDDWQRLVIGASILLVGLIFEHRRPEDGPTKLGSHCLVQFWKIGTASFFHVVQIHIEG